MEGTRTYPAFHSSVYKQPCSSGTVLKGRTAECRTISLERSTPITGYPINRLRRLDSPLRVTNALVLKRESSREISSRKSSHI